MNAEVTRPIVRYHGGKWMLAPWIIEHMPKHRTYTEPFGGGASVLLRKDRSYAEIYNDLDGEIVNVFRMVRDRGAELVHALHLTPFARTEFEESYMPSDDPIVQARRTIFRSFAGFGSAAVSGEVSGFRASSSRSGTTPAHDWRNFPECLVDIIERLRGVIIEMRPAEEVIAQHDSADTLHYLDPPYVHSTRSKKVRGTATSKSYRHEMNDDDHHQLSAVAHAVKGMVLLSGYRCPLYDSLFKDWHRIERKSLADGARPRVEVLYMNGHAVERMPQPSMFGRAT